ncbi:hypothetical protein AKO1_002479 [Acrasis kona]
MAVLSPYRREHMVMSESFRWYYFYVNIENCGRAVVEVLSTSEQVSLYSSKGTLPSTVDDSGGRSGGKLSIVVDADTIVGIRFDGQEPNISDIEMKRDEQIRLFISVKGIL